MLWIAGTIVCLTALLGATYGEQTVLAGIAKTAASTCFIMVAVTRGARLTWYGRLILGGLAFSWFGDVFLIFESEALFLAGLVSFLLGHFAYVAAFAALGILMPRALQALGLLALIAAGVLIWLLPHVDDAMKIPVLAYIFVISLMVAAAFGARAKGAHIAIPIGATMFFLSDIAVARRQFVVPDSMDWAWGLPLYYIGQLFLAYSVSKVLSPTSNADSE